MSQFRQMTTSPAPSASTIGYRSRCVEGAYLGPPAETSRGFTRSGCAHWCSAWCSGVRPCRDIAETRRDKVLAASVSTARLTVLRR
jgi:hypothetical protein